MIYKRFGFKDNPFFTHPLEATEESPKKFVGRKKDIQSYMTDISGSKGCVHLVTGKRGVGKTSFVNVMQYVSSKDNPGNIFNEAKNGPTRMIPGSQILQLNEDDTVDSILLSIASNLIYSIRDYCLNQKLRIPAAIDKYNDQINSLISSEGSLGGGISLAGIGVNLSVQKRQYHSPKSTHTSQLVRAIKEIVHLSTNEFDRNGIFLSINNLDIIDINITIHLLNQLRDYLFNIDKLWINLLGQEGIYEAFSQSTEGKRISDSIRGFETCLQPMSEEDTIEILKIRAHIFSTDSKEISELPLSENLIRELYKNSGGEIRLLFHICDSVVREIIKQFPSIEKIDENQANNALQPIVAQMISFHTLPKSKKDLLQTLLKIPLRPKDYKQAKCKSAVDFTNQMKPLLNAELVTKKQDGNAVYYFPSGRTLLANYCDLFS